MIEIHRDLESIGISPFQEKIALENYFAGANRDDVLFQMKEAMQERAVLMVLTGEEGSGKTMVCHMLKHEASPLYKTVLFPRAVDSFEEVVEIICHELGLDVNEPHGGDIESALDEIATFLLTESSDLLVVFDEAENLFLATLERICKMREQINESGARMHVLFSARESFLENCDQLSVCDFQRPDEHHFTLVPLSQAETGDYLRDCAARLKGIDAAKVFTDEVIQNIYELAKGNFRMTNILGEESAKTQSDDTSFMVLLDSVEESAEVREQIPGKKYPELLRSSTGYLPWIGGAVFCLLLFFFLFGQRHDKKYVEQETHQPGQVTSAPEMKKVNALPDTPESKESMPVETAVKPPEKNAPEARAVEVAGKNTEQGIGESAGDIKDNSIETTDTVEPAAQKTAPETAEQVVENAKEIEITAPHKTMTDTAETVVQKHSAGTSENLTYRPKSSKESPVLPSKAPLRVKGRKVLAQNPVTHYNPAVDKLYNERLLAGREWERNEKQGLYTVQIMALASQDAEQNLKKMLAKVNYRQEAGNFYILKKSPKSGKLFVFYGEYPSLEIARLVTISLPTFLRDHNPYPLSIKGAIAKVRK